jgi:predicted nicotinamide N-methyase
VRLHLAHDAAAVWSATQNDDGRDAAPIPFWAFAWSGGLALARFLADHPDVVAGQHVLDFGTGSGLVAIVAARLGAASVVAADVDPFAETATELNAKANRVRLDFVRRDLLTDDPPDVDVLLAGDTWYEGPLAERVLPWLRTAARRGIRVLVGDPGRRYLPSAALVALASFDVQTTTELEDSSTKRATVFTLAEIVTSQAGPPVGRSPASGGSPGTPGCAP